jgi:hypothetical protein
LARGSILENLEVLCNQDVVPKDPLAQKVQTLLRSGYNRHLIERGLRLLNEVQWSTAGVEQGHGSTAVVHRYHPMFSPERLATRAFLHMFAQLLGPPEMHTSAADRHMAALKRLLAKVPRRVQGMHMFSRPRSWRPERGSPLALLFLVREFKQSWSNARQCTELYLPCDDNRMSTKRACGWMSESRTSRTSAPT